MTRQALSTVREQAASFAVAALMTVAVLASLGGVANAQHAEATAMAAADEPAAQQVVITAKRETQQVVIVGQRIARS